MRNKIKIYQVDAFTSESFKGNPAAVCILEDDISDELMKNIAQEMNLSETAFVKHLKNSNIGKGNLFSLRWFTPEVEVDLCGHATIATSKVLFDEFNIKEQYIKYETKSGLLTSKKKDEKISLDFPIDKALDFNLTQDILDAMGIRSYSKAIIGEKTRKLVIEVKDKENIINLKPNFEILKSLKFKSDVKGIGVTCRGNEKYDFISRYFNPWAGINEDLVTGSVHTLLANYWSNKLNKMDMNAYQASNRSGEISLKLLENDRVKLSGETVIVLRGELYL
ncbi:PhzF family phenazine biosynthesis protein [Clostridium tertium]|uniref:PhzF family phenazine biosynthesis protein n=1 Tax=Clostridium TaxID=1485 RepID=UPI000C068A72|nr:MULTISPECIES: PhzF family phenazine biosynthesis protein [Clostridium]MDB1941753.1 PhzF family phenazine biosynthesis protein [Clostridium tertium]MDB1948175.1 PhzF family phenazine biosynthesis protein [Clostridium tertium]MDB1953331.1 PhzF family phenazine biosynthesis protein [Clostridium tertium]MDB1959797.1 PhzF family phenazine biosynthesis protein [Clostridium tertium]MDB1963617.1 PhzF family phenazine biosynthesis protein [Clostridium tertium]